MIKAAICLVVLLAMVITVAVLAPVTNTRDKIPLMRKKATDLSTYIRNARYQSIVKF